MHFFIYFIYILGYNMSEQNKLHTITCKFILNIRLKILLFNLYKH